MPATTTCKHCGKEYTERDYYESADDYRCPNCNELPPPPPPPEDPGYVGIYEEGDNKTPSPFFARLQSQIESLLHSPEMTDEEYVKQWAELSVCELTVGDMQLVREHGHDFKLLVTHGVASEDEICYLCEVFKPEEKEND